MPKPKLAVLEAPMIPAPEGTAAARDAIGPRALFAFAQLVPIDGGFLGRGRSGGYSLVSSDGEVRPLGIDMKHVVGFGAGLPGSISPDRRRMLIIDEGRLTELTFADGSRRPFGGPYSGAAWLDDERAAVSDDASLSVVRVADNAVLAKCALARGTSASGARPDGLIVTASGDLTKPKTRAIEVFHFAGAALEPVGRRTKVPFSYVVPFDTGIYLIEQDALGRSVKCYRVEMDK